MNEKKPIRKIDYDDMMPEDKGNVVGIVMIFGLLTMCCILVGIAYMYMGG